ncbi:magnesium transporter NIPA-domain-containing protein [Chlamydoabsidia padenii]|nr:magnesium transporter NIPA-domain-containing protein [Chlamydoabsidia padenii]
MSDTHSFVGGPGDERQAALFKGIGCSLAVGSGILIGSSFVLKKKGLLQSTEQAGGVAGEGYHYLRSVMWWSGMILMMLGELCNFIAYAFAPAVLVTPLGALSVVISAILSSIILKERLSFHGKVGCLQCIIGAVMIVLHAPTNAAGDSSVEGFKHLVLSVGFLVYASLIIIVSLILIFYCGPRWGKKNMLVYISICSVIGSLSVVFTQGFGSAIIYSIGVSNQFTNWFIYIMVLILVSTLILEIVYLNKALNLFNTALVTPTYYVIFTTMTIISSTILFQGFNASGTDIASCVMGFFCICSGVALLHHSSASPTNDEKQKGDVENKVERSDSIQQPSSLLDIFDRDSKTELANGNEAFFSAPFNGIGRYASTTRSMRLRQNSITRRASTDPIQGLANKDIDTTDDIKSYDYQDKQEVPSTGSHTTHVLRFGRLGNKSHDSDDDHKGLVDP